MGGGSIRGGDAGGEAVLYGAEVAQFVGVSECGEFSRIGGAFIGSNTRRVVLGEEQGKTL